jgi:Domain of unknown function (DUF4350)
MAAWLRKLGPRRQALLLFAALVMTLLVVQDIVNGTLPGGGSAGTGPTGSSFSTSNDGIAAWASLLKASNQQVSQRRSPLGSGEALNSADTLVVLDGSSLNDTDVAAVKNFLAAGGHLVTDESGPLKRSLFEEVTTIDVLLRPLTQSAQLAPQVDSFTTGGATVLPIGSTLMVSSSLPAGTTPIFVANDAVLVADITPINGGHITLLANPTFLSNAGLAVFDSAAFAVSLGSGRPVVFAEEHHGYGASKRLDGVPARWRWGLVFLALATLAAMWSRGRRNGPAEPATRDLPPPRRRTIDMVATSMVRSWSVNGDAPIAPHQSEHQSTYQSAPASPDRPLATTAEQR